jgi:GT2 family glycosyltransferase
MSSNQTIFCSVCIANYNGANVIEACLNSVFKQDFHHPIEVIVHDDASSDKSTAIVTEKFPTVRLIKSKTNVGFCVSNNRMVAVANGKYILLLNNDAELHTDALSSLFNFALQIKKDCILGLPQYCKETGKLIDIGSLFDPFLNPVPNNNPSRNNVGMVIGACLWLPKNLWDEIGGFPEWFDSLAEDMYICCCARLRGYPVIAISKSGFNHWVGSNFGGGKIINNAMQTTYRRRALSERNKSYVMFIYYPNPLSFVIIPLHLALLILEGLILSMVKRDGKIWRIIYQPCFKSLWNNRKKIIAHRNKAQSNRQLSLKSFFSVHTFYPHKLIMLFKYGLPKINQK